VCVCVWNAVDIIRDNLLVPFKRICFLAGFFEGMALFFVLYLIHISGQGGSPWFTYYCSL